MERTPDYRQAKHPQVASLRPAGRIIGSSGAVRLSSQASRAIRAWVLSFVATLECTSSHDTHSAHEKAVFPVSHGSTSAAERGGVHELRPEGTPGCRPVAS